jgi:hypothetical protein
MDLVQDLTSKMSQTELLTKIGWNALKAFITSIILVAAFVKAMDLINYFTPLVISQVIFAIIFSLIFYYYYFWSGKGHNGELALNKDKDGNLIPLTLKDFFYTDKISSEANAVALITSFIGGTVAELGLLVVMAIVKFCVEHSNSDETMSLLRVVVLGVVATGLFIYTQRNSLDKDFWGIILRCILYGFTLSILSYTLGIIIGVSNMVLGIPITMAILILQITFTSFYTYTDLLEWAKQTHKVVVKEEPKPEEFGSGMKTEV